jgi:hypothetical protein
MPAKYLPMQERLTRSDPGVDWGAPRRILIRTADHKVKVFIREGHSRAIGAHGFGQMYEPAALIVQVGSYGSGRTHYLAQGRVTKGLLRQHAAQISHLLGSDAWEPLVDPKKTIVVD